MSVVYVVMENGDLDLTLYKTFVEAREAAIGKYKDLLDEERAEAAEWRINMASKVDVEEDQAGTTKLYIEKEIYITIQRYNLPN